jgi:integrase
VARRNNGPRLRWFKERDAFYIVWCERGRSRKRSTGTRNREEAEIIFAQWLQVRRRDSGGPRDPTKALVTDVLNQYLLERGPKVSAEARIAYALVPLIDFFEGCAVADVTPETCERYTTERARSSGTVRRELGVLRAAINHAHKRGRLTRSVAVDLPQRPPSRDKWLTRQGAAKLIKAARTPQARLYLPLYILISIYTGRRKEAILSLRWTQVDLEAGLIDFDPPGRQITNKKRGKVRIPRRLLAHLRRARDRGSDLGFVIHNNGKRILDVKKGFAAACRRAGLEAVTPHTLRHTCATWLMQAGVEPWEASGFLSMSMETLTRTYAHHHPDWMKDAADAIGRRRSMAR